MSDLDLDSLLSESLEAKRKPKALKAEITGVTKRPKTIGQANKEWLNSADKSDYERRIENARRSDMWRPQAAVAMFSVQLCLNCGSRHTHFEGFFIQSTHAASHTERWVLSLDRASLRDLPHHRKITVHEADACIACADALGFVDPSTTVTEPDCSSWNPHTKPAQGGLENANSNWDD